MWGEPIFTRAYILLVFKDLVLKCFTSSSQASATSTQKSSPINAGDSDDYNSLTNKEG